MPLAKFEIDCVLRFGGSALDLRSYHMHRNQAIAKGVSTYAYSVSVYYACTRNQLLLSTLEKLAEMNVNVKLVSNFVNIDRCCFFNA